MDNMYDAVVELAKKHFGEYKIRNGQLIPRYCPICGGGNHQDKDTFAVGLYNGCWSEMRGSCPGINGSREGNFKQLCNYFGETSFEFSSLPKTIRAAKKVYSKPDKTKYKEITEEGINFLASRGISPDTIKSFDLLFLTISFTSNRPLSVFASLILHIHSYRTLIFHILLL